MTYLRVAWIHDFRDEPVDILCETDEDRREVRKVERFPDGSLGFAGPDGSSHMTRLATEVNVPPFDEVASDPQFRAEEVGRDEFERVWAAARVDTPLR